MKFQILSSLALAASLQAQVYTPPAGGNSAAQPSSPPQDTATSPKQQTGASPFGQEIPMLIPRLRPSRSAG